MASTSMIELMENALPFEDARKAWFRCGKNGEPVHAMTLRRWIRVGVGPQLTKLRVTRFGGAIYITREAAEEFLATLNGIDVDKSETASHA